MKVESDMKAKDVILSGVVSRVVDCAIANSRVSRAVLVEVELLKPFLRNAGHKDVKCGETSVDLKGELGVV